ncbi:hypothetical protein A9G11_02050 [Gilliamella sp. wkB108]|nr:1,6-anhydro-N-acetylmuramyl-L-alanine amidase AmpD [Gilliamella apicola]OCG25566.1 hypothetical protein A9G11_02050 [Gilliamella apicola]
MSFKIINGWLQNVKHVISPFYNERPIDKPISLLVIHNISLPPNQYGGPYVEQLFTGQLDPKKHPYFATIYQLQVSSHLFIRRNGEIIQFVPFDKRAWHAGQSQFKGQENCNDFSIGIELEGCDSEDFTEQQYQQLATVTVLLQQSYSIVDIVGHNDIAPERKTDPGPYFNWQYYLNLISEKRQTVLTINQLNQIEDEMQKRMLWQTTPPKADAFLSQEPFAIDTMEALEWLQWIFIPRMRALIDAKTNLPQGFALHPYFEEALKEQDEVSQLLLLIKQLDDLSSPTK